MKKQRKYVDKERVPYFAEKLSLHGLNTVHVLKK